MSLPTPIPSPNTATGPSSSVGRPVFVAVHPRACSTAFERVFMTCPDTITCIHEPFGDAYYYGPERMAARYAGDEHKQARLDSGFSGCTYRHILDRIEREEKEGQVDGKRVLIKDIMHYLVPPPTHAASKKDGSSILAPSLVKHLAQNQGGSVNIEDEERGNPTVIPRSILARFDFAFLIRHPQFSIPSYYRCTIPPLSAVTGFHTFLPEEAGYAELRRVFDYLRSEELIGSSSSSSSSSSSTSPSPPRSTITLIDADDLLHRPEPILRSFCNRMNIPFDPATMLDWSDASAQEQARVKEQFEKWTGFHDDALKSTGLIARADGIRKMPNPDEGAVLEGWTAKYGAEPARLMMDCVRENVQDYEYLKQFALTG